MYSAAMQFACILILLYMMRLLLVSVANLVYKQEMAYLFKG